jgi:uncharacterized membrane protein
MAVKNKFGLFSILLVFLLSLVSATALQESFAIGTSVENIVACSNSVTTNSITVRNTGDIESGYMLDAEGSALEFATFSETSFSILPGESRTVYVYYAPGDRRGAYDLEATVTTSLGSSQSIENEVTVQNCANLGLSVKNPVVRTNPCEVSQFSFLVRNNGDYTETYEFGFKGMEQYATLSTDFLILTPGEQKQVDLFVNPACEIYGQKELAFQALARTSQFLATTNVVLDIARNYDYSVTVPAVVNICNMKESRIPVAIKNNIPILNTYEISVRGPAWIGQEAREVLLPPLDSGITNIVAYPQNPGSFLVDVITKSTRGEIVKAGALNITVDKCYATDFNIDAPKDIVVAGHRAQYQVSLKNEGTKNDSFTFELVAPEWLSLNANTVLVRVGETKTFSLEGIVPANETGTFVVSAKAISSETKSEKIDVLELKVIAPEDAYDLAITPRHTRILYNEDAISIKLENKGILPATYDLSLNGPRFASLALTSITLQPGEEVETYINTNARDSDPVADYEMILTATVRGENIGFVSSFNTKLRPITFAQEIQGFIMKYLVYIIAGFVVLMLILFFAIFGKRIAASMRARKIRRQELARVKAEMKARLKEEKLAKKMLKEAEKRAMPPRHIGRKIFGILLVLIALAILAGAFVYMAGYAPFITELLTREQASEFEPIIKVDTDGLEALGNTVMIRGTETVRVPIIVKNNYDDDLVFDVQVDTSWIKTDTEKIELEPGEEERIILRVTPEEDTKGLHRITVSANLERENKLFTEEIRLNVKQKNFVQDLLSFAPYFGAGLVLVIIGLIVFRKRKTDKVEVSKVEKTAEVKAKKAKPSKKITLAVPRKR